MSPQPGSHEGVVVVDKPAGWTSHDVVARLRRLAGTRRVGHAGSLDPMATGVLVLGIERATRLLGHLALTAKAYDATIRLGSSTITDDAEGEALATSSAASVTQGQIAAGLARLTGDIEQVPSAVSALKVRGERAYAKVRAGQSVTLAARSVRVYALELRAISRPGDFVDLDVSVACSSGTYVRALARDLGADLGVGGHLTALRRTRVGPYGLADARTLDQLEVELTVEPLADVASHAFPRRTVSGEDAVRLSHGVALPAAGIAGTYAAFGPDGAFLALLEEDGDLAKPQAVFRAGNDQAEAP